MFFFVCLVKFLSEVIWPWTFGSFFIFVFLITDSISLLVISLLKLFIFDSALAGCMFPELCLSSLLIYNCSYVFIFLFCVMFFSPLQFLISFIWVLFSWWESLEICQFVCLRFFLFPEEGLYHYELSC